MLPFKKMHGCGNDFIMLDARAREIALTPAQIRRLADRRFGIGCDQLVLMGPSDKAGCYMHIYNPDGSKVATCGNATRCVGALLTQETGEKTASIETDAGVLSVEDMGEKGLAVNMGAPRFDWRAIPLASDPGDVLALDLGAGASQNMEGVGLLGQASAVSMGNPHLVFFVENVEAVDMAKTGASLETHPLFPEKTNVSIVQIFNRTHAKQVVFERGAGLTLACGSAACAATAIGIKRGLFDANVQIDMPGGSLWISWDGAANSPLIMQGPATFVFEGMVQL